MESFWQDLRYGIRVLTRKPGFTAIAVLTLALGIGANTAIFSVVNAVLLRPLNYERPGELYLLWTTNPGWLDHESASLPDFLDWRSQNQSFEDLIAISRRSVNFTGDGEPERLIGANVSAGFFTILGAEPLLGRGFLPEEDRPGGGRVVILTHRFWQRRFGTDPDVLGRAIALDGDNYTVVGVAPAGFQLFPRTDLWMPLALDASDPQVGRRSDFLRVLGRLRPGVGPERAQSDMTTIARRLEQEYPQTNTNIGVELVSLHEHFVGDVRPALLVLWGTVGIVLLIACANVTNLLLARATSREKEVAIRAAMGAGRLRLVRQLLTESMVLASLGGAGGLLLAAWGTDLLIRLSPANLPRLGEVQVDQWVLGFTLLVSVLAGGLFGLFPALQSSRAELNQTLKDGGRSSGERGGGHKLRSGLVVAEVALALCLLVAAGLMIRTFYHLQRVETGFDPENLIALRTNLPQVRYPAAEQVQGFYEESLSQLENLPGMRSVTAMSSYPLGGGGYYSFQVEGKPAPPPGEVVDAQVISVMPNYFHVMRIPLLRGRAFDRSDRADGYQVVVINQAMVRRYFAGEDPIGQRVAFDGSDGQPNWREIVGVAGDVKQSTLDTNAYPEITVPHAQQPRSAMTILARTNGDPQSQVASLRAALLQLDPNQPMYAVRTLENILANSTAPHRFNMLLLGLFAGLAFLLAVMGLYGVISYSVAQRTHEIGIRLALGARPGDVFRMVVGQGFLLVMIGVGVGLAGALAATRLMESLLFGVSATDPVTFAGVAALLTAVALVACYIPARRATRVDPMVALRYE